MDWNVDLSRSERLASVKIRTFWRVTSSGKGTHRVGPKARGRGSNPSSATSLGRDPAVVVISRNGVLRVLRTDKARAITGTTSRGHRQLDRRLSAMLRAEPVQRLS